MALLACATLSLGLLAAAPQEESKPQSGASAQQAAQQEPVQLPSKMKESDIKTLRGKATKWVATSMAYNEDLSASSRKKMNKAKEAFLSAWKKQGKDGDPLRYMGDVVQVFSQAFTYGNKSASGEIKKAKDGSYSLLVPKGYRPANSYPCVLQLPGKKGGDGKGWKDAKSFYEGTWKGTEFAASSIFVIPNLDAGMDLATNPDMKTNEGVATERILISGTFLPLGDTQREYNLDRSRFFLDCGSESSVFGLRLASHFPSRFAGVILRQPGDMGEWNLESLGGIPVLLLANDENKAACEKIKASLAEDATGKPSRCEIMQAKGEYPYLESAAEIGSWASKVQRDLFPKKVVLTPTDDFFLESHWVRIMLAEPLELVAVEERPRLVVEADRASNTIKVDARNVSRYYLYLNDALVDLDKEITLVVNGKEVKETLTRNLNFMKENMIEKFDPTFLYTVGYNGSVPKPEPEEADAEANDAEAKDAEAKVESSAGSIGEGSADDE